MKRNKKGFTLVELVIVIAVIAILAGVMIAVFSGVVRRANENAELQQVKNDELKQKAEDVLTKLDNANWFSWEDFENSLATKLINAYKEYNVSSGTALTEAQVKNAVKNALDEYVASSATSNTSLTETQVKVIVENALANAKLGGVTEAQVRTIVNTAVGSINTVSKADIQRIVDAATSKGLTAEQVAKVINDAGLATSTQLENVSAKVNEAITAINALKPVTKKDVSDAIIDLVPVTYTINTADDLADALARVKSFSTLNFTSEYTVPTGGVEITLPENDDRVLTIKGIELSKLTVNAPMATIYLVSDAGTVEIMAINNHSFHVVGKVNDKLTINSGRVVVEDNAVVNELKAAPSLEATVKVVIEEEGAVKKLNAEYQKNGDNTNDWIEVENNGTVVEAKLTLTSTPTGEQVTTNVKVTNGANAKGSEVETIKVDTGVPEVVVEVIDKETGKTVEGFTDATTHKVVTFKGVAIIESGETTVYKTLEEFRDSVNDGTDYAGKTVLLLTDLDLENVEWEPIGTSEHPFRGVFDGQGHTIENFKIRGEGTNVGLALFGCIEGTASTLTSTTDLSDFYNTTSYTVNLPDEEKIFTCVVKNLNVSGADVNTTADGWTAAVVAYIKNATVSNIHLSNSVITAEQKVGGIVGFLPTDYACYITNCATSSNVTVTTSSGNHCAGILARVYTNKSRGIIANCTNNATINCAGVDGSGISGLAKNILFYNNINNGNVTGKTCAGGIATDCDGSVFINCTNNGYIKTTEIYSKADNSSAGIASYLINTPGVIVNCHNSGTIEGNAPKDDTRIAGIAGAVANTTNFINNSNTGTLINHAENGKVYDICNLSTVAAEVNAVGLEAINTETAKDNKYIRFTGNTTLAAGDTVAFNGQEKIEFVNSPKYLTLDLSGANKSSFVLIVNDTVVTLKNGGDNYVTISGKGNTVKVEDNETVKSLTVSNDDTQSASSFNISGNATKLVLKGNGLVNGEIAENATAERVVFSGKGTFTLTNRGTISHTTSGIYGNEHTIDTINSCNITIHNYGTIEAKKNSDNAVSYALLFYGGATVKLYAYNGSNIIAEGNMSVIVTNGGTQVNVYYQDGAKVTRYGSETTYPKAFGYYCTVTIIY